MGCVRSPSAKPDTLTFALENTAVTAQTTLNVQPAPALSLNLAEGTLYLTGSSFGHQLALAASLTDGSAVQAEWTSDRPDVATVQDGLVTGLSEGSAVITATYREKSVSCRIQVVPLSSVMTLPSAIRILEEEAFCGSIALEAAALPHGLTSIGARAFADCENLKIISIPASVTEIGADAFANCAGVRIDCIDGSFAHEYALANGIPFFAH